MDGGRTGRLLCMSHVIVVGAGIAGVACARELLRAGHAVSIREQAAAVGGRMASPRIDGRPIDLGAAYFTASDPAFVRQAQDWCDRGLARRWTDRFPTLPTTEQTPPEPGPWRYAAPGGLGSLVADLAAASPAPALVLGSPVRLVEPGPAVDGEPADAVVLAMPDPQAERVLDARLAEVRAEVASRRWEPVLALMAGFSRRSWPAIDGAFISGDRTLGWLADDGSRRGDGAPVLVAHSTSGFAARNLEAPQDAAPAMVSALDRLLGCGTPAAWGVRPWPFARPAEPRDAPHFLGTERIGLAGDGWGSPRIQTAWLSGRSLGQDIARKLGG
jgi:renalase